MFFKKRRRGVGITGILLLFALLFFTPAGKWIWDRVLQLENQCYGMVAQIGVPAIGPACGGVGSMIRTLDRAGSDIDGTFTTLWQNTMGTFMGDNLSSVVGNIYIPDSLRALGSGDLQQKLRLGPYLDRYQITTDALSDAVDSFAIGQDMVSAGGDSVANGVTWLKQGASHPGYGLLAQLSLGDIYREGEGNVPANPLLAQAYYTKAHQSIGILQANNSPAAKQILATLPASPEVVKQQLVAAVKQLKIPK